MQVGHPHDKNLLGVSQPCLSYSELSWLCQGCRRQGGAGALTGTGEVATYRIDAVKESIEQFLRRTIAQLPAGPSVQFVGSGQDILC